MLAETCGKHFLEDVLHELGWGPSLLSAERLKQEPI
jgi:hypothetical protein